MKIKFLNTIRKPWTAVAIVLGVCLIHYLTAATVLETTARVKIPHQSADDVSASEIPDSVLDLAFAALDAERTKAGKKLFDIDAVAKQISVSFDDEEKTLQLRCLSQDGAAAVSILNALATAYVEDSRTLKSNVALPRIESLQHDEQQARRQLEAGKTRIAQIERELADEPFTETAQQALLERLKAYSAQIAAVKADRLNAEARYREATRELETGSAINLVAAQLATGSAKDIVQAVMGHADLVDALERVRETKREYSQYYGARHPRMLELQAREEELVRQIDETSEASSGIQQAGAVEPAEHDRGALLLKSLALDLRRQQGLEDDLQVQWDLEQARLDRQTELHDRLRQAQLEAKEAEEKLETIAANIASTQADHRAHATIIAPAETAADPVSPSLTWHLLWGCLAAVAVGCLSRWAFRELKTGPAISSTPVETPPTTPQPPLYARRLIRLAKMNRKQEATP